MLKIFLPLLLFGFSLPAFAQTEDSGTESTSSEVIWLNSDFYNSIRSGFDEFTVGAGYRYDYIGLGLTAVRTQKDNYDWYSSGSSYTTQKFLNAYCFIPIDGAAFALYATYGFELENGKFGNEGIGIHVPIGSVAIIGVGGHAETGFQLFIGAQL